MRSLYVMGDVHFGFAQDFYDYVLRDLGFDLYRQSTMKAYYFHLLLHKYDLIWACSNARGFLTVLLKRFPLLKSRMQNTKVITRFHRKLDALFSERPEVAWMPYMSIVGSDKVAWVYDCFDHLKKYVPKLPKSKFYVVHNGVDLNYYKPNDARREEYRIFTLSSWHSPKKRLELLIEAMNYLPKWRLDIAGRFLQNDYEIRCRKLARPHKDRIHFHGFVKDKLSWMQRASVFVMPSRQESWSTQVMEAMACGCLVIAPQIGGIPSYIPEIELVSIDVSAKTLAEKIQLISNKKELKGLNRSNVKPYSWDNIRKEVDLVLMQVDK